QLLQGNLGYSFSLHRPVRDALAETIPFTLQLAGVALLIDFLVGLGLGIYQALRVNRLPDVVLSNVTLFAYSLPTFWLALVLLLLLLHQLRNALLSFITRFGLTLPFLLTGAVLIETIFAWPGMGRLAVDAILTRDHALVTATGLIASTVVVSGNFLADILIGIADPRVRVAADGAASPLPAAH